MKKPYHLTKEGVYWRVEEWDKYLSGKIKYDLRFDYYRYDNGDGSVFYNRVTKLFYRPVEKIGYKFKRLVYWFHKKFSKKRDLNPYCVNPYRQALWFIRRNITMD